MSIIKRLPSNILNLKPYVAGKSIEEVKKEYQLERIAKLASNENRLGCSPFVEEAVMKAFQQIHNYPRPAADDLRHAIAEKNGVNVDEILVAAGSESIISILCRTCFKNDEHAITADATFVGFFVQAGVRGIKLNKVPITEDYRFDVRGILDEINDKTKMVYIANPNNPTGTYITKDEYQQLLKGVPEDVLLIVDEAYYEYAKSVEDYPDALYSRKDNVIILRTFSKAYGLAGMRIGYAIANRSLITEMMKTKLTFEPSALAQAAALAAYKDDDFISKSVHVVEEGKERLYSFFESQNISYRKSISNSVMIIFDSEKKAANYTQKMLENGVILRQIGAFGLPNCIRVTIGTKEDMQHFENVHKKIT